AAEPAPAPPPDVAAPPAPNVAPRIVSHRPPVDALEIGEGATLEFAVRAADENPGDRLAYAWRCDGRLVSRSERWRFVAPAAADDATHVVEVRVTDAAG